MRNHFVRNTGVPLLMGLLLAGLLALECDSNSPALRQAQDHASDLARQLAAERDRFQRESVRWDTRLSDSESDTSGALLIWGGTALGLALAMFLLARERRGRWVLEQLLRRFLDRLRSP